MNIKEHWQDLRHIQACSGIQTETYSLTKIEAYSGIIKAYGAITRHIRNSSNIIQSDARV